MLGDTDVNESNVTFLFARETKLNTSEINPALEKLVLFMNLNAEQKEEETLNPESGIVRGNEYYVLYHNGKMYSFTLLEDKEYVQQVDKDILADKEKRKDSIFSRTLRLASSCHFADAKWILATSPIDFINCLIETENMIIDYQRNLIMDKEEYYTLFDIKEISRLDRYDVCSIYQIILERPNSNLLHYFLLAPKEMLREIYKNFPTVLDFASEYGIHERNCLLWNDIDFFNEELDKKYLKYKDVIKVLEEFTLNPNGQKENFKKVNELLYEVKFTDIEFSLVLLSFFLFHRKIR